MRHISFLMKPASSLCNLRCRYCFYEDEAEHRAVKHMGVMTQETADALLSAAFAEIEPGGTVSFAFQGGEPTLAGLSFFRHFTGEARRLCPQRVRMDFSIQTNGMALDEQWAEFLRAEDFLVGLSIDGTKDLHELYRVDALGKGSWGRVTRALQLLQKAGVRVNALCVVTNQCARHPDQVWNSLRKLGLRFVQFIPCLDPLGEPRGQHSFSLQPETYGRFLCRCFDLWYRDWKRGDYCSVRLFEDHINLLLGEAPGTCATCGRCGSYFVVEGDGGVYPCDFYVLDRWRLGSLPAQTLSELDGGAVRAAFLDWGTQKPTECADCRWRLLCNGGCKRDWVEAPDGPHNYYCEAFRALFAHAEPKMAEIARAEQLARRQYAPP